MSFYCLLWDGDNVISVYEGLASDRCFQCLQPAQESDSSTAWSHQSPGQPKQLSGSWQHPWVQGQQKHNWNTPKPQGKRSMVGENVKKAQMWEALWSWSCARVKQWNTQSSWALRWGLGPVPHLQTVPWDGRGLLLIPPHRSLSPTPSH